MCLIIVINAFIDFSHKAVSSTMSNNEIISNAKYIFFLIMYISTTSQIIFCVSYYSMMDINSSFIVIVIYLFSKMANSFVLHSQNVVINMHHFYY